MTFLNLMLVEGFEAMVWAAGAMSQEYLNIVGPFRDEELRQNITVTQFRTATKLDLCKNLLWVLVGEKLCFGLPQNLYLASPFSLFV